MMGIFSNDKKACPICGNATPRLFPTKVEGLPICKDCVAKINMEHGMLKALTINELWEHLDYRKENREIFAGFIEARTHGLGGSYKLRMDMDKKLFYIAQGSPENPALFKYEELKSFALMEDGRTVAQGNAAGFTADGSSIENYKLPGSNAPAPQGVVIQSNGARVTTVIKPNGERVTTVAPAAPSRPAGKAVHGKMTAPGSAAAEEAKPVNKPVDELKLSITLDNKYWKSKVFDISLPSLNSEEDIPGWIEDYKKTFAAAMDACEALAGIIGIKTEAAKNAEIKDKADAIAAVYNAELAAKEAQAAAKEAQAADESAVIERLKKWKELLDMGAISQEEFDSKKKELLG